MILRPIPATLRGAIRAVANKPRPRPPPRPGTWLSPTTHLYSPSHTAKLGSTRAITTTSTATFAGRRATRSLLRRSLLAATRILHVSLSIRRPHTLLNVFSHTKQWRTLLRSDLLRGALGVFKSSRFHSAHAVRSAYDSLGRHSLRFSHGARSGLGTRPPFGPLALSPLRGGVGLQTARKFSSGGARVFDNLVVQAPLALRLAVDEADDKAKLLRRAPAATSARTTRAVTTTTAGVRRTGTMFGSAKLASNAFKLATAARGESRCDKSESMPMENVNMASETQTYTTEEGERGFEAELSTYFQLPTLCYPTSSGCSNGEQDGEAVREGVVVTLRLVDSLYDTLGGRDPVPAHASSHSSGPRMLDSSFFLDVTQAAEYEHRRYLRAKSVLRILWSHFPSFEVDISTNPTLWTVSIADICIHDVQRALQTEIGGAFDFDDWVEIHQHPENTLSSPESSSFSSFSSSSASSDVSILSLASPLLSSPSFGAAYTQSLVASSQQ